MVQEVGRLLRHALVGLLGPGSRNLGRLLPHLLADPGGLAEKLNRVGAGGTLALPRGKGPLERRQGLVCGRKWLALNGGPVRGGFGGAVEIPVEAGSLARVAGGAHGLDERDDGVAVAVLSKLPQAQQVPRGLPLAPDPLA